MEALVLADAAVTDDVLAGLADAIAAAGGQIVGYLGERAMLVEAGVADLPNIVLPPFTVLTDPDAALPAGLDDTTTLYAGAWQLTAGGPLAETGAGRTDDGVSFADLGACVR